MNCIKTVQYEILVNGESSMHIIPSRGLQQGDPLSPYLFILCAEGLSTLLYDAESTGKSMVVRWHVLPL